jgi:hypothetical protein
VRRETAENTEEEPQRSQRKKEAEGRKKPFSLFFLRSLRLPSAFSAVKSSEVIDKVC